MTINELFSDIPYVSFTSEDKTFKNAKLKEILNTKPEKVSNIFENFISLKKKNLKKPTNEQIQENEEIQIRPEAPSNTQNYFPIKELTISQEAVIEESSNKLKFLNYLDAFAEINDLSSEDKRNLNLLAGLESSYRQNPKENNKAFGYFLLTPTNIKKYSDVDIETFKSSPEILFDLAYKHYKNTKKEMQALRKLNSNLSDFQLIYGLWFAGLPNMKKYLLSGYNPSDGNIKLTQALEKAKNVETSKS